MATAGRALCGAGAMGWQWHGNGVAMARPAVRQAAPQAMVSPSIITHHVPPRGRHSTAPRRSSLDWLVHLLWGALRLGPQPLQAAGNGGAPGGRDRAHTRDERRQAGGGLRAVGVARARPGRGRHGAGQRAQRRGAGGGGLGVDAAIRSDIRVAHDGALQGLRGRRPHGGHPGPRGLGGGREHERADGDHEDVETRHWAGCTGGREHLKRWICAGRGG
ncbi:MAG: hypothetical protein J3K34DRAFT_406868 [Monoraphidium minutum]|nr:MAG: hypothetical protein J3K34DRAFT_406868 [Monoraphidium minutum]